ncbi:MAG: hypothetical protein NUV81_02850 [bacterium]|nr:hypothetical protein [bacterium]
MPRIRSRNRRQSSENEARQESHSASLRALSRDEKRGLILAHAEARKPIHPRDRITLWGGVIVCALFIAGAWFATAPSGIGRIWAKSPEVDVSKIKEATAELQTTLSDTAEDVQTDLESAFTEAQNVIELEVARQSALEALQKKLGDEKITPDESTSTGSEVMATSTQESLTTSTERIEGGQN